MNQILTFQLASISLNAEVPENNGISGNGSISEAFEDHGLLRFSLSNLPGRARANLSAILAEKQSLINKAIPDFTMEEDSILIGNENSFISPEKEEAYRQFLEKLFQTARARKWVVPNRKNTNSGSSEKYRFRNWLNQIGLKGVKYANVRKILTENLSGSSAYSSQEKMEAYNKKRREARQYERNTEDKSLSHYENLLSISTAENPLSIPAAATFSSIPTAIYCRVSTLHPHQQDSLENQIRHYQEFMKKTPNYILTEIYYDFGISGYKETRPGFCKMMEDARKGCFRQIITKSITRFARNTDTVLKTTRQLKELGVDIYFELQKIHTLSQEGELLLTLFAAFAQAESENARWLTKMAIQQKYRKGHPMRQLHRCLGYQKDQAGNLVPDKNAELVRQIFQMAADGWSISQITKYLNENKITTQNDRTFSRSTVSRILHNHAYKGDYICQRYYVNNQRKLVRNKGEKQMYYIRHDHPAIVSEEMWETAQEKLAKKSERNRQELPSDEIVVTKKAQDPDTLEKINQKKTISQKEESGFIPDKPPLTLANYPYKDRIFCKYCGSRLRRIIARNHSVWWICNGLSRKGKAFCKGVRIPDEKLSPLRNIRFSAYIGKELIDGKETYGYSSKPDEWKR